MNSKANFKKTSVTHSWTVSKVIKDYKYITSLGVALAMLVTSGVVAYDNIGPAAPMEVAEVAETSSQGTEVIKPVVETVKEDAKVALAPTTIIADRKVPAAGRVLVAETAIEEVASYKVPAVKGYSIVIAGSAFGFFENKLVAGQILEDLKKPYTVETATRVYFKENVAVEEIRKTAGNFSGFSVKEQALKYIVRGTDVEKIHQVADGENFWGISKKYDISIDDLIKANPKVVPEKIKVGDKLSLTVAKPLITVCTVENVKYKEEIPYAIKYTEAKGLYKGQSQVKVAGKKGLRAVEAELIKENGVAVRRVVLSEVVLNQPATSLVAKGIKEAPKTVATGKLAAPYSRGKFSSGFGRRWGRMHEGVDWSMPVGSVVKAADGGVVISAGSDGAYGLCIVISHGNGLKTVYAHNSKLLVKAGEKVYKGEQIAKSGNTGRSTGPHLHFEVRKNGTPVNPLKYLK